MDKKKLLYCFGGGKNQKKLIQTALDKRIETIVIEYKKIRFDSTYFRQLNFSCYFLTKLKSKKNLILKLAKNRRVDVIYRSSGPSILTFWYLNKILNLKRVSKELAFSVYSKSFFCKILKKNRLPYMNYQILNKNKKIKKFNNFVLKPDAPIVGKINVFLSSNRDILNFKQIQNSSHNKKVICLDFIDGIDVGIFIFIRKIDKKKIFLKPFIEKNKFIKKKIKHFGIFESKNSNLNNKIINLSKKILKIFPNYYGFLSITFRVTKKKIIPYEINLGLSGDKIVDKIYNKNLFKKSLFELEIDNLCL